MATDSATMTSVISTYKWLVKVASDIGSDSAAIVKLDREIREKCGNDHVVSVKSTGIPRVILLEASSKAITELQILAWIDVIRPHNSQLACYEIYIVGAMSPQQVRRRFTKLKLQVVEMMLNHDIVRMSRKGRLISVICTERGRNFLVDIPFLSSSKRRTRHAEEI